MDTSDCSIEADSEGFIKHLTDARNENLSDIERSGCTTIHYDETLGHSVIIFIPKLAFHALRTETEEVITRKILLHFVKVTTELVQSDYSIIYCHTAVSILSQQSLILEYYKIMPRRYKKNLKKMFILHPQFGIKLFFEFTKLFVSAKFYNKLVYVENITMLQKIFPPYANGKYMELSTNFVYWEDTLLKKYIEHRNDESNYVYNNDLKHIFIPALKAPYLVYRCCEYIRFLTRTTEKSGMRHEGLFRLAGDHSVISLVRIRLQLCNEKYSISKLHVSSNPLMGNIEIVNSSQESKANANEIANERELETDAENTEMQGTHESELQLNADLYDNQYIIIGQADGWTQHGYSHSQLRKHTSSDPASIVVSNIDSVAQVLKLVIADLPNPLIVYSVYEELLSISKTYLHPAAIIIPTVNVCTTIDNLTETSKPSDEKLAEYEANKSIWRQKKHDLFQLHMPMEHLCTLEYLIKFLAEVSTYSDTNKMTVENLAIVFAPIILRSNAASMDQMAVLNELNTCKLIVKMLILDELSGVKIEPKTENEYQKESAVTSDDIAYMMDSLSASSSSTASDNGVSPLPSPHTSNSSVGRVRLNLNTREKRATRNVTVNQTDEL